MGYGRARWRVYLALCVASLLWGSLYTAAKPAVEATGALQVTLCRVVLACLCLGPLVVLRSGARGLTGQLKRHWRGIVVLGLLNFAASQILALASLNYLPASVTSVLNNTHPLWVAIGTALLVPPRQPLLLIGGSAIALLGVVLVFVPDLLRETPTVSPIGAALALGGSGVIAIGTVVGRRVMRGGDPLAVAALASGAAILPMAVLTAANGGIAPIVQAPIDIKLLLLYVGVGCTAVNFALWYYGLKYLSAAAASAFQYLIAPIGVALAAAFLGEPIGATLIIGTAFVLVGLAITQRTTTQLS